MLNECDAYESCRKSLNDQSTFSKYYNDLHDYYTRGYEHKTPKEKEEIDAKLDKLYQSSMGNVTQQEMIDIKIDYSIILATEKATEAFYKYDAIRQ